MFVTADQLFCHGVGDYILQSHWMATTKTKSSIAALCHVATYIVPFVFLTTAPKQLLFIAGTHFLIDRYRLARYVVALKNAFFCDDADFYKTIDDMDTNTGYPADTPVWLSTWLLIIADNLLHIACNAFALNYL